MRRFPRPLALPLPAVVTGALLLTACGTQQVVARSPGSATAHVSPTPGGSGAPSCGGSTTPGASATPGTAPEGDPAGQETEGVRSVGPAACPEFEVTNDTAAPLTYTITFQLLSESGAALTSAELTVPSVGPGRTVRRAYSPDDARDDLRVVPADMGPATKVRIIRVRSVPSAEAPSSAGPCPPSGVRVYADKGDAAMGLRVVGLHLENCGTHTYDLDGYPQLRLFDEEHKPVEGVRILHGGDSIATGTGADGTPRPLTLKPGEGARAGLVWRNTTGMESAPVNAPYVRVVAKPGATAVTVTPELDLGTTGKLGVGPWQRDETSTPR